MNIKYILLALLIIIILLFIYCLLNRKTEGFKELKRLKKSAVKVPLDWQALNTDELPTIYNELRGSIERKLKVDADEMEIILNYKNVDYKRSEIMKIKDRKVQLEALIRSLDDWNKKFDSEALNKTSKIEEINSKIEELEKDKKDISSNFDSKADLYSLNNSILEII
jgi:peptidoglycan hydrolase CwlO-like protein